MVVRTDYFPFQRSSFQKPMLVWGVKNLSEVRSLDQSQRCFCDPPGCLLTGKDTSSKNHFKEIKSEPFPNLYFHVGLHVVHQFPCKYTPLQPPPTPKSCHTSADPIAINSSMQRKIIFAANILRQRCSDVESNIQAVDKGYREGQVGILIMFK